MTLATLAASLGACGNSGSNADLPVARIAIVIGPAGSKSATLRPVYDWAIGAVNESGGAGGRHLEAQYFELNDTLTTTAAQEALAAQIVADPDVVAVAGTFSFAMAPKFVAAGFPYITPETSDADVFRAFHGGGFVWRTLESDSTELWFLLAEARGRGLKNGQPNATVGLVTSTDSYGKTFFDWYGFHATELGLNALEPVQYDQDHETCDAAVDRLLKQGTPSFLIAVPSGSDPATQAACMVKQMRTRSPLTTLLFADSAHIPGLISMLGTDAEGLSGYSAAPDPTAGFAEAFTTKTGISQSPEHAANTLDAIAILAYGLQKSGGQGRRALDSAMRTVVSGRGRPMRWDQFRATMDALAAGESPDLVGASGPLTYDRDVFTDPTATFYDRWIVSGGAFAITHHVTTETDGSPNVYSQAAVARGLKTLAGDAFTSADGAGATADLPPLHDNWALVVATSSTWANYRHQSDALAQYQALKANGFDDDHIVLITADDLAGAADNHLPGEVVNTAGGPDVHAGAVIDYKGTPPSPENLMTILSGGSDPALPAVLHSRADDNIYVYLVGHGGDEGPYMAIDDPAAETVDLDHTVSPLLLASTIARMKTAGQFRRMFIAVDACHAGVLGPALEAEAVPDVILFAAAAAPENSFSANYATDLGVWTADEFSSDLLAQVKQPTLTIRALYEQLYGAVSGSHVQAANVGRFGAAAQITFDEFVKRTAR